MFENMNLEAPMAAEKCYEKAIEGYQFQVNRYHTWMNYYSVFVGAFFVALYTVWNKGEAMQSACCKCCKVAETASNDFWPYLLIVLGWIASVCWLASLIGHRAWMGSWLRIVKEWEITVLGGHDFVYRKVILGSKEHAKDSFCGHNDLATGYISTQKITTGFVCAVILAWELMFCYLLLGQKLNLQLAIGGVISFVVVLLIKWILRKCCCCLISDDLTDMIQ